MLPNTFLPRQKFITNKNIYICHLNKYDKQNEDNLPLSISNATATWHLSALFNQYPDRYITNAFI